MNRTCIIVAGAKHARFFLVEANGAPRHKLELVECLTLANPGVDGARKGGAERVKTERVSNRQAGDIHPIEARRQQHRLELERRFGREIARHAGELTGKWKEGTLMLVAEPRMLGLTRTCIRDALSPALVLRELARNYTQLTAAELRDHLDL